MYVCVNILANGSRARFLFGLCLFVLFVALENLYL